MPEAKIAGVGIQDARGLMPGGRAVYAAVRDHIMSPPRKIRVFEQSPAADL